MSEANNIITMPGSDEHRVRETGVLLKRPRWVTDFSDHDVVYALSRGRVGRCPLARYRVPEAVRDHVLVMPDSVTDDTLDVLATAALIADRVAPWVTVHVVPRLATRAAAVSRTATARTGYMVGDQIYRSVGGLFNPGGDVILVVLSSATGTLATLCHELLHAVWWNLSEAARDVLQAAAAGGIAWTD